MLPLENLLVSFHNNLALIEFKLGSKSVSPNNYLKKGEGFSISKISRLPSINSK